jgi:hypothetical protein
VSRRRTVLWLSIGYILLSIALWMVGGLRPERMFEAGPLVYIGAQWFLGPLAFPLNVGAGIVEGSLRDLWVIFYVAATALLALCLFLAGGRPRWIRTVGVLLAILIWLASGFVNFLEMFAGI